MFERRARESMSVSKYMYGCIRDSRMCVYCVSSGISRQVFCLADLLMDRWRLAAVD